MNMRPNAANDPSDPALARLIQGALGRERTPDGWVEGALAMARRMESRHEPADRRADLWVPAIASGALFAGLGAALFTARGAMGGFLGLPAFPSSLPHGPLALIALAVLPPAIAFVLAESVRGFPLVRRWFA